MYLYSRLEGRDRIAATLRLSARLPDDEARRVAERAEHLEVWATRFSDPGPDYCEVRVFDAEGTRYFTRRIDGY